MYWIHTGIPQAPSKAEWLLRLLGAEDSSVTDVPVHLQHEVTRFLCWCYFVLLVRFHFLFIRIQSWTIIMCGQIYHQFEWLHVLLRFIWIVSQTWIHIAHETFFFQLPAKHGVFEFASRNGENLWCLGDLWNESFTSPLQPRHQIESRRQLVAIQ